MAKAARHHLDIYGVHLYLATTKAQWKKLRKELSYLGDVPESAGLSHFAVWEPTGGGRTSAHLAFWIDPDQHDQPGELIDTCAHEAAHGANAVLDWIEHDTNGTANEPHAYLVGWLTRWLWTNTRQGNE